MDGKYTTYISYIIYHKHEFAMILSCSKFNFYLDNESQQVAKWSEEKQKRLSTNEKIVIINFFHVSNIK